MSAYDDGRHAALIQQFFDTDPGTSVVPTPFVHGHFGAGKDVGYIICLLLGIEDDEEMNAVNGNFDAWK